MAPIPPPDVELRILEAELAQLESRRAVLLARRAWLVDVLDAAGTSTGRASAPPPGPPPPPAGPPPASTTAPAPGSVGWGGASGRPDASPPRVQNVLLVLGGVLLTVAAIAFTVVSWGHLGIAGRSAVLGTITAATLAVPRSLLRRGLRATAEAVAGLGLALTVLDAYALHRVAFPATDGSGWSAAAAAALAAGWAGYGLRFPALRVPPVAALAAAQLPLPLWAVTAGAERPTLAAALLVTAVGDAVLALRRWPGPLPAWRRAWLLRGAAALASCGAWVCALPLTATLARQADTGYTALRAGGLLVLGAVPALAAAWRVSRPQWSVPAAFAGGVLVVAAASGPVRVLLPAAWGVPAVLGCAVVVTVAGLAFVPHGAAGLRRGLAAAGLAVLGVCVLRTVPLVAAAVLGPVDGVDTAWAGPRPGGRAVLDALLMDVRPGRGPWTARPAFHPGVAALVMALAAGVLGALASRLRAAGLRPVTPADAAAIAPHAAPAGKAGADGSGTVRARLRGLADRCLDGILPSGPAGSLSVAFACAALGLAWATLVLLPAACDLPYPTTLTVGVLSTAAGLAVVVRAQVPDVAAVGTPRPLPAPGPAVVRAAQVLALVSSGSVACLALAARPATLVVLSVLTVLCAVASAVPGDRAARYAVPTAVAALGYATALAVATGAALGLPAHRTALLVLVVPAVAALLATLLGRHPLTVPVECGGALAGVAALTLTVRHPGTLALVLGLCGVIAAGTAVRAERRHRATVSAMVLLVAAAWVRLALWDVTTPECYTLPVTVPALWAGAVRRRRDPSASSWLAYGPGLAATAVPSLATTWADPHWLRPLLLGVAALVVTLAGARLRLRAPLMLGGAVLAVDTLHELAPFVVQVAGVLPRWVPPALVGLLLLALGATYERRLRDVRRVRAALGRMR